MGKTISHNQLYAVRKSAYRVCYLYKSLTAFIRLYCNYWQNEWIKARTRYTTYGKQIEGRRN